MVSAAQSSSGQHYTTYMNVYATSRYPFLYDLMLECKAPTNALKRGNIAIMYTRFMVVVPS